MYSKNSRAQGVIFFGVLSVTLAKTIIYGLIEVFEGYPNVGHNDASTLLWLWIIPNGIWIVVPFFVVIALGQLLAVEPTATEKPKTP